MICNNCFSQIPDGETFCPHCKKRVSKKRFQINIPEEKLNEEPDFRRETEKTKKAESEPAPVPVPEKKPEFSSAESIAFKAEKAPEKPFSEPKPNVPPTVAAEKMSRPPVRSQPVPQVSKASAQPKVNKEQAKKEKTSRIIALSLCTVCFAAMIGLSFISKYTDVFKTSAEAVKTVAFSGFSNSEKASFEEYASFFPAFFESGFNRDEVSQEGLLEMMKPESSTGLYGAFFTAANIVTDEADPANRFKTDDGYSYCKVKRSNIKKIASGLGSSIVNCANGKNHYYYDGYYYFAAEAGTATKKNAYSVEVSSSKRTEDGNYYVQCDFTDKSGEKKSVYCVVSLEKQEETLKWSLLELSLSPLFSEDGVKITEEKNEALSFKIERKKISAKTTNGVLFANYIIEYPVFSAKDGDEDGKKSAEILNTLYNELITKYRNKAKKADRLYKRYLELGGNKKDLPAYAYVTSKVTYNKNGYISLLEETDEYLPIFSWFNEKKTQAEENGESLVPSILLPTTTFEGYTLEIKSGEFLKKDSVLGKDYYSVQQKLFEIYLKNNGLLSEDYTELPTDSENIGQLVNSSAWCIGEDGVLFSYIDPKGYNDSLTLPFSDIADSEIKF